MPNRPRENVLRTEREPLTHHHQFTRRQARREFTEASQLGQTGGADDVSDAAGKILQFFLLFLRVTAEGSQVRNLIFAESLNGFSRGEVRRTDQGTRAT